MLVQKAASYKTHYSQRNVDSDVYIWMTSDDSYRKIYEYDNPIERVYKTVFDCLFVFHFILFSIFIVS